MLSPNNETVADTGATVAVPLLSTKPTVTGPHAPRIWVLETGVIFTVYPVLEDALADGDGLADALVDAVGVGELSVVNVVAESVADVVANESTPSVVELYASGLHADSRINSDIEFKIELRLRRHEYRDIFLF